MKQFFRFFRGELNGFFINAFCTFMNAYLSASGILDELIHQSTFQWVLAGDESFGKTAMREEDMYGIGKIGGLFQPRTFARSSVGSIWFTPSSKLSFPGYEERSERGLLRTDYEDFMFIRMNADDFPTDISVEADESRRITYRDERARLLGYIAEDALFFHDDGAVDIEQLLEDPPTDRAYVEFYGLKYLFYEERFEGELPLTPDVYKLLFESVQRIRRKGPSILALMELTEILGGGYITDLEITQVEWWFECRYTLDEMQEVYNRERRYAAWLEVGSMKFKEFVFINRKTGGN